MACFEKVSERGFAGFVGFMGWMVFWMEWAPKQRLRCGMAEGKGRRARGSFGFRVGGFREMAGSVGQGARSGSVSALLCILRTDLMVDYEVSLRLDLSGILFIA